MGNKTFNEYKNKLIQLEKEHIKRWRLIVNDYIEDLKDIEMLVPYAITQHSDPRNLFKDSWWDYIFNIYCEISHIIKSICNDLRNWIVITFFIKSRSIIDRIVSLNIILEDKKKTSEVSSYIEEHRLIEQYKSAVRHGEKDKYLTDEMVFAYRNEELYRVNKKKNNRHDRRIRAKWSWNISTKKLLEEYGLDLLITYYSNASMSTHWHVIYPMSLNEKDSLLPNYNIRYHKLLICNLCMMILNALTPLCGENSYPSKEAFEQFKKYYK